jgi:hypothetical protein
MHSLQSMLVLVAIAAFLTPLVQSGPCLIYFYGTFDDRSSVNSGLVNPNCETGFDYIYGVETPYVTAGSVTIARMAPENVTYDYVAQALAQADYVAVDELDGTRMCPEDCGQVVSDLQANGMGGRIIFWMNISPGNTAIAQRYDGVLSGCAAGYCRALVWETYATSPSITTTSRDSDGSYVQSWVNWVNSLGYGAALSSCSILGYGIANNGCPGTTNCYLNDPPNDFLGMLDFFSAYHQYAGSWPGIGLYSPADTVSTASYQQSSLITHLQGYLSWW